jgi:hypothetical protein
MVASLPDWRGEGNRGQVRNGNAMRPTVSGAIFDIAFEHSTRLWNAPGSVIRYHASAEADAPAGGRWAGGAFCRDMGTA